MVAAVGVGCVPQVLAVHGGLDGMHHHPRLRVDDEKVAILTITDIAQPGERLLAGLLVGESAGPCKCGVLLDNGQTDMRHVDQIVLALFNPRFVGQVSRRYRHQQQGGQADQQRQPELLFESELAHPHSVRCLFIAWGHVHVALLLFIGIMGLRIARVKPLVVATRDAGRWPAGAGHRGESVRDPKCCAAARRGALTLQQHRTQHGKHRRRQFGQPAHHDVVRIESFHGIGQHTHAHQFDAGLLDRGHPLTQVAA